MTLALPEGLVCGVDEAGRGSLAGPVVVAAVILDTTKPIEGLNDSKKLSSNRREKLAELIHRNALAFAVTRASVEEIDKINILQATLVAMQRAVEALNIQPRHALIDGNRCPALLCTAEAIPSGDGKIAQIAAASILAKTARDALMKKLHESYPLYGFAEHKGYPTASHLEALKAYGITPVHRLSYAPVARLIKP